MRKVWVGLAASLVLAACEGRLSQFGQNFGAAGSQSGSKKVGQTEATVTRNKTRILAVDGFCVDPVSTRSGTAEAFLVFGNCAAITGNPDQPQPYLRAVATAAVTDSGVTAEGAVRPQVANLNAYFRTAAGRAALSRSNVADTVEVLDGFADDGALFLRVRDSSDTSFEGAAETYWRAYFDAGNSVVALSVIGFSQSPISSGESLDVLRSFVDRNQRAPAALTSIATNNPADDGPLKRLFP
ncbi:MAG: hypothetical protein AAGA08_04015 [Pseudomonadota bacterium]